MYCSRCGTINDDNATRCVQCGQPLLPVPKPGPYVPVQSVPNYLVQSILVTLFCCLPFGIVAIVFAAQVDSKVAAGDYAGALDSSNKAKMWCWVSFGLGISGVLVYACIMVLAAAGA